MGWAVFPGAFRGAAVTWCRGCIISRMDQDGHPRWRTHTAGAQLGLWIRAHPGDPSRCLGSERGVQEPVLKSRDPDDLVLQILQHISQPAGELGHTIVTRIAGLTSPRGFPRFIFFSPKTVLANIYPLHFHITLRTLLISTKIVILIGIRICRFNQHLCIEQRQL